METYTFSRALHNMRNSGAIMKSVKSEKKYKIINNDIVFININNDIVPTYKLQVNEILGSWIEVY